MKKSNFSKMSLREGDQIFFDEQKDLIYKIEHVTQDFLIASRGDKKIKIVCFEKNKHLKLSHKYLIWEMRKNPEIPKIFLFGANKIYWVSKYE